MQVDATGYKIETQDTGYSCALLGLLLAASGGFVVHAMLTGSPVINVNDRPATPADAWIPMIVVAVGVAIAGLRWRSELDINTRTLLRSRRLWMWVRETREELGELQHVLLRAERRGSGKNSNTVYAVRLVSSTGDHEIDHAGNELQGRRYAEAVATACRLPLHDARGGTTLIREYGDLDRSVLDIEPAGDSAMPPSTCRIEVQHDGMRTVVRVPSPLAWLLPLGLVPAIIPALLFAFWWSPATVDGERTLLGWMLWGGLPLLMCCLPFACVTVAAYRGGWMPRRLTVEHGALYVGRTRFEADQLEELHVSTGHAFLGSVLRASTDEKLRRIGRGLRAEEAEYLRSVLLDALRRAR